MVDKLGPFVMTDFLKFFTFLPVPLNLAYSAPLYGAGRICPENFNYQRCLENSSMMNLWLTSMVFNFVVTDFFSSFFLHFLPWTRVCNKQPLINTRPKYYFDNPFTFLETRGKNGLISDPCFVNRHFFL